MRKWYPLLLVAGTLALSAATYSRLPERVAIHFDLEGNPNGYGSRWEALFAMPIVIVFVSVLTHLMPRLDPRRENYARMQGAYFLTVNAALTIVAFGHLSIIGTALGWPVAPQRFIPAMVGGLFIVIGNVLPQARPNWFFGIRTPWTLTNDRVWERTHRVGGYLMFGAGVVSLLGVLFPLRVALTVLMVSIGIAIAGSIGYSYVAWKQETSQ